MGKERDQSHILTIVPNETLGDRASSETAIEALLEQRQRLVTMLSQIDGDLESLGYKVNESQT
jgi:peptidoglycan hydrolase CwlO-like protein